MKAFWTEFHFFPKRSAQKPHFRVWR